MNKQQGTTTSERGNTATMEKIMNEISLKHILFSTPAFNEWKRKKTFFHEIVKH